MPNRQDRSLKISGYHRDNKEVPELRLAGIWMEQLGFTIGERVNVTTRDRLLVIEPIEQEQEKPNYKEAIQQVKQALKKIS